MSKMYTERKGNIAAFRGCAFDCVYCAFKNSLKRSKCPDCRDFKPHAHLEVLDKTPPKTRDGEFLTMGMNGDIAFATNYELARMMEYCNAYDDRTFVLQTKNPSVFGTFENMISSNMIIGTTLESNSLNNQHGLSKAPPTVFRAYWLKKLNCRKMVTVEPIMRFDSCFINMIVEINPEIVYVGYDSKNNRLDEPPLKETKLLISYLRENGFDVREKLIRPAWYETE